MEKVQITTMYITLGQFLKLVGEIGYGGEAKEYLTNTEIRVDGKLENRRGRKLYDRNIVEVNKTQYLIVRKI